MTTSRKTTIACSNTTQVRVAVRVRPLTTKERDCKVVVDVRPPASLGIAARNFTFDLVFDPRVAQAELYDRISPNLLSSFLDGFNATVMAYGQTGSGKTFTMGSEAHHAEGEAGLIPRFMTSIFTSLEAKKETLINYSVKASFLEVYGEDVHDLLDQDRKTLPLRDDAHGGVVVTGLTYRVVSSADDALDVLNQGTLNRTTAATLMNLTSSRSHAVFTIYLSQTNCVDNIDVTTTSKFTLVDLAGSERMKKTGAVGERALEGIKINEGLLALGNVINALADDERILKEKKIHVPYRQSKLTRLLQDALGGNSQTLFIACVSSADINASETLSTLHYANRARNIKNALTRNVDGTALELQRLQALNIIYCKELVQHKFGSDEMDSPEVMEYLRGLHDAACFDDAPIPMLQASVDSNQVHTHETGDILSSFGHSSLDAFATVAATPSRANASCLEDILDESILEEVNPEEELAILDQLLELQNQDHEFSKRHRQSQNALKQVQGELEEQESLLLQLRESLKVYHNMKEKYQMLMAEVQQLEMEKLSLADQLEKASIDPTKGCSLAIKKKLERVEASLTRARIETRKHQQKYREAEQQAQKCKALERKVLQLKQDKVNMIKKQKEAAVRHREFTEQKTRELLALKRKERTAGAKVTKLQSQIQRHKNDLSKRKAYSEKMVEKLKETEAHLMKLLSIRSRELHNRQASPGRRKSIRIPLIDDGFSKPSQEVEAIKFILNRLVADRVSSEQARLQYQDRLAEYSELMRKIREEVKVLDDLEQGSGEASEQEELVEDLELKLEIVSGELEALNVKVQGDETSKENSTTEMKAKQSIGTLTAPVVRSLLWEFISKLGDSELERISYLRTIEKKESVIQSFEAEVRSLNQRVSLLSSDLAERRKMSSGGHDPFQLIQDLRKQLVSEKLILEQTQATVQSNNKIMIELKKKLAGTQLELLEVKEKLTLAETMVRQQSDDKTSASTLDVLQTLWRRIGVPEEQRERSRLAIMTSLDDTCRRQVNDARKLKKESELEIEDLHGSVKMMALALGMSVETGETTTPLTLFEERDHLQAKLDLIKPVYDSMLDRRDRMVNIATSLMRMMDISIDDVCNDLRALLANESDVPKSSPNGTFKDGPMVQEMEGPLIVPERKPIDKAITSLRREKSAPRSLESAFLDRCEQALSNLRLQKSRKAIANSDKRKAAHALVLDMHVTEEDITELIASSAAYPSPAWWEEKFSARAIDTIVRDDCIVEVSRKFSEHLDHIFEVLSIVSRDRQKLSSALKDAIHRAQRTLLSTVGEEVDASEAYASFHEALFNLPSLSKEHIETCIEEIKALTAGVEAMTQSEIEALSVVWEALQTTTKDKASFWGDIEEQCNYAGAKEKSAFESIQSESEEWVSKAAKEAATAYQLLTARLHKLEQIHLEVEKLRSKQDAKSLLISLDSEIRILTSSLAEFEDKKCNKERLLTKKAGSSTLLREERFRKQMQEKFISKMHQLKLAVKSWKESDGNDFEDDVLSAEVRLLLDNPDQMDNIVKQRTSFMHLRTVQSKAPLGKRTTALTPLLESPATKRLRPREDSSEGSLDSAHTTDGNEVMKALPPRVPLTSRKHGAENHRSCSSNTVPLLKKRKADTQARSPSSSKPRHQKEQNASPSGLVESSTSRMSNKADQSAKKRGSLMPFANILNDS